MRYANGSTDNLVYASQQGRRIIKTHPCSPTQAPVKPHVPPALEQSGMVGAPEYPVLQVAEEQLPTAELVAAPVQPYPVVAMQAAA